MSTPLSRTKLSSDHRTVRLVHGNVRFESFLADLSATFVDVPADQIDSQVTMGLRQIVKFLGVDRSGFGQLVPGENKFAITHSYQVPGVPPTPKVIVDDQFPILRQETPRRGAVPVARRQPPSLCGSGGRGRPGLAMPQLARSLGRTQHTPSRNTDGKSIRRLDR